MGLRNALEDELDPNLSNRFHWTLLMIAALEGNIRIGELLLSHAAVLHAVNDFGETALCLAAHKGHEPFVRLLLRHGATADCKPHGWELADWIVQTSGLGTRKIHQMLNLIHLRPSSATLH